MPAAPHPLFSQHPQTFSELLQSSPIVADPVGLGEGVAAAKGEIGSIVSGLYISSAGKSKTCK